MPYFVGQKVTLIKEVPQAGPPIYETVTVRTVTDTTVYFDNETRIERVVAETKP